MRKTKPRVTSEGDMRAALQQLSEDRVFKLMLIRADDVIRARLSSNPMAQHILIAVGKLIRIVYESEPGEGPLCVACDTELSATEIPGAFGVVIPYCRDLSQGAATMAGAFCRRCRRRSDADLIESLQFWLKQVWPDFQEVREGNA